MLHWLNTIPSQGCNKLGTALMDKDPILVRSAILEGLGSAPLSVHLSRGCFSRSMNLQKVLCLQCGHAPYTHMSRSRLLSHTVQATPDATSSALGYAPSIPHS